MPSGKQLAFTRGEVSPPFRYKSSSITYNEGLHKLRNGFPRRGGGISNRSGFRYITDLTDTGIEPQGVQSNTKLFYVRRNVDKTAPDYDSNFDNNELYFFFGGDATTVEGFMLRSDFTKNRFGNVFSDHQSQQIHTMSYQPFEDSLFLVFGKNIGLNYNKENYFFGRNNALLSEGVITINQRVVSDIFHRRPIPVGDGTSTAPSLPGIQVAFNSSVSVVPNLAIRGVYVITEELANGEERFVCGYEGSFVSYQGIAIKITLFSRIVFNATGNLTQANVNTLNQQLQTTRSGKGILILFDGTTNISIPNTFPRGLNDETGFSALPTAARFENTGFPADGFFKYNLYRGFTLNSTLSLVSSVSGRYKTFQDEGRLIVFDDTGAVVVSRGVRDGFRLFGGTKSDNTLDNTLLQYDHIDTNGYHTGPRGDVSTGPHRLYRPFVTPASSSHDANQTVPFVNISRIMRYQQRTFVSYTRPGPELENTKKLTSVIGVSKVNTDYDFSTGSIVNPVDAFEFNIPINDPSPIVAMLPAERPLIFTESNVFMLLGADAGIVTPTEINPITVYTGGCSATVQPVLVDNQAFLLSNDHTSLVLVDFNKSGGRGVTLVETDAYAKHFLEKTITQIAVVKSFETIVWLLREDGSLLSMTMTSEGDFGFGQHELSDGFIENISSARYPQLYQQHYREVGNEKGWNVPDVEVLAATIVRDDRRTLEIMTPRDDRVPENMGFADGFKTFGMRLSRRTPSTYYTDLERENHRFDVIKSVNADIDNVMETFKSYALHLQNDVIGPPLGALGFLNFTGRSFDPETNPLLQSNSLYSKAAHEMINITRVMNTDEREYLIDFNVNAAIYSFLPPGMAVVNSTTAIRETEYTTNRDNFITLLKGFLTRFFPTMTQIQKRMVLKILQDGAVVFTHIEKMNYYYNNKKYELVRRSHKPNAPTAFRSSTASSRVTLEGDNYNIRYLAPLVLSETDTIIKQQTPYQDYYDLLNTEDIPEDALGVLLNNDLTLNKKLELATHWTPLTKTVTDLDHLAGKEVAVFADNEVVSSPLSNDDRKRQDPLRVKDDGTLELKNYYEWGIVGLPYEFEMESLQIEAQNEKTLISGKKMINRLAMAFDRTREGVEVASIRDFEYDEETDKSFPIYDENIRDLSIDKENGTFSGVVVPSLASGWSEGGRVRITNADPTPVTVNAIYPKGIESGE